MEEATVDDGNSKTVLGKEEQNLQTSDAAASSSDVEPKRCFYCKEKVSPDEEELEDKDDDVSNSSSEARDPHQLDTDSFTAQFLAYLSISKRVLEATSIEAVAKYIKSEPSLKIVTMVGAGISTAAGIPDFRSPGTGIYNNLKKYNLPYTNAIFELDYFLSNPEPFYQLAGELMPGTYKPTKAHYFIKLLEKKNLLLRHFSQNIDNLDRLAGISEEKLVEAHGSFNTSHCTNKECKEEFKFDWLKEKIQKKEIPKCTKCGHVIKPDIIFFGEQLPKKFFTHASDLSKCGLLIIMGSSLAVEPFASLAYGVRADVPRLMINATQVGGKIGLTFSVPNNRRDVLWIGECDKGCEILATQLGWKDELDKLCEE